MSCFGCFKNDASHKEEDMYFDSKNLNRLYPEKATVSNEGLVIAGVKEYQADDIVTST